MIHLFDQGFASAFWLGLLLASSMRFVLRWRKDYQLLDAAGNRRLTWKSAQGKRGWSQRWVWDAQRARWVISTVLVLAVAHPDHPEQPLSLVGCRSQGRSPWYVLTADPIQTDEQAWHVGFASMRRWQIDLRWKYEKSELAFQSPRVSFGDAREKLLRLSTLAYAFLLTLLNEGMQLLRLWLLRSFAHRTGSQCRTAKLPLTRLRCALSRVWQDLPPTFRLVGHSMHTHPRERSHLASTSRANRKVSQTSELLDEQGWLPSPCSLLSMQKKHVRLFLFLRPCLPSG